MKKILIVSLLLISSKIYATATQCFDILMPYGDSQTYQIDLDDADLMTYGKDHLANAIVIVRYLLKELGCSKKDINFGKGPDGRSRSRCQRVEPLRRNSLSCYIESNLGYFFVNWDYQSTANIIFARWD